MTNYEILKNPTTIPIAVECYDEKTNNEVIEILKAECIENDYLSLTSNQIGYNDCKVAVVKIYDDIITLVNPEITSKQFLVHGLEADVSFPNKIISTERFGQVTVKSETFENETIIGLNSIDDLKVQDVKESTQIEAQKAVFVQHAIDMLNGITMFEHEVKLEKPKNIPIKRTEKKYQRNERIYITNGTETKQLKYKYATQYLNDGWKITNQTIANTSTISNN